VTRIGDSYGEGGRVREMTRVRGGGREIEREKERERDEEIRREGCCS